MLARLHLGDAVLCHCSSPLYKCLLSFWVIGIVSLDMHLDVSGCNVFSQNQ